MTIPKTRVWVLGTALLALLALVASWFLLVLPKRAEAAALAEQRASVEATNATIATRTAQLKAQFATLDQQRAELEAIRRTLPADTEVPALLRELETAAQAAGLDLTAVTPGAPEPYPAGAGASAGSATGGPAGIYAVPLTIAAAGSFAETELFLKQVQADMQRFLLVEGLTLTADPATSAAAGTSAVDTTLSGKVFVLRTDPATPAAAAAPAAATADALPSDAGAVG